ncbi:aldehyde dehydrogenase family protein [Fluviispira multicolorata]|uniref:Aldehyde dehydrogenase family protein n=1 Tax=Fluviispira multicolorata TaxID=2654512 RepID=A0A833JE71_9BACT|nr:aldehyde dehydrogenase [Fluviispira multicolorata]KAB8032235.1 aldehyde dehydrogenase family protein [Fluviispira multicolorata]
MATNLSLIPPYINGRFSSLNKPERIFSIYNPANPSDILAAAGWGKDLVEPVIQGMKTAQKKFNLVSSEERLNYINKFIGYLKENSEEIKSNMMLELARSRVSVEEEWKLCEKLFKALPEFCKQILSLKKDDDGWEWKYSPLGLVLISSNIALPVYSLLCGVLPALASGNAVCLRPSSHCLLSGSLLASGFHQASFPEGTVQIIYGDFEVFRRLVLSHQFDTILYTGGEESLEQIRRDTQGQQNARLVLCGGGKNAAYVSASANMEKAIEKIIYGACLDAGQRLESTSLVFVEKKIFSEFQDQFVTSIKNMPIGVREDLARADKHVMEPLCSVNAWERYLRFQGIAARESDETLRWGKPIDNGGDGYFVSPGVHLMRPEKILKSIYASNAFFGPDVCLVPVDGKEDVISILDSLGATRCLGIHSQYAEEAQEIRRLSNVPSLLWNSATTDLNPLLPSIGRGKAGNSYITGLHFIYSTIYPQTLNLSLPIGLTEGDFKEVKRTKKAVVKG